MLKTIKHNISKLVTAIAAITVMYSCSQSGAHFNYSPDIYNYPEDSNSKRVPNNDYRKVFIVYMMGFNNLTSYLRQDTEDLINNCLISNPRDALIIFSHRAEITSTSGSPDYNKATSPILTHIYRSPKGETVRDTIWVMPATYKSSDASTLNKTLRFIQEHFEADSYGLLMSSHGTGWMPENYCNHPNDFDPNRSSIWSARQNSSPAPKPYMETLETDGIPPVKSMGVQNITRNSVEEMDITDIAKAIPMKMDFIIFDACFMGGVEVAYEFRNVCDKMIFSQTEILADGMDYENMASYIFRGMGSDLEGFCENYYQFYDNRAGSNRSATISLVDCTRLEPLAEACRDIFSANRAGIAALEGSSKVQRYYRNSYSQYHKWFFDLYDILLKSGATVEQLNSLKAALDGCILYKAATKIFIDLPIETHCGLSMYLPYADRDYLNDFYKTLEWNIATGLVQ